VRKIQVKYSATAEHALTIYEPRCTADGITIRKSISPSTKIVLRRGEMMQVTSNLIVNSIYAMPHGGTLSISVCDANAGNGVVMTVEDDGVGIAPKNLPKIFDAFFTTRTTVGTGIGLFIAKQFVEGHGGTDQHRERKRIGEARHDPPRLLATSYSVRVIWNVAQCLSLKG
jgi:signal transduction histidine kinase